MPNPEPAYGKDWPAVRAAIIERDHWRCRICGQDRCEISLHVHHVDRNLRNINRTNLVTLCRTCHGVLHREDYYPADHPEVDPPWGVLE